MLEIAKYYENTFSSAHDLDQLILSMKDNYFHQEAFVYGVYFAAWIKSEVNE